MQRRLRQLVEALFLVCVLHTSAAVLYVDLNSPNPTPPFTNWVTAAANIQDAVDAADTGDQVLVTNGIYQTGGQTVNGFALTNRVVINKAIIVESVNGPAVTTIQGYQVPDSTNGNGAVRCVYMTNNAALIGFTLTGGATRTNNNGVLQEQCGGGIWCDSTNTVIQNCLLVNDAAAWRGGGAANGNFSNCTFTANSAGSTGYGGGAYNSVLNGCCLIANTANYGGGASAGILNNCTLTNNSAFTAGGGIATAGGDCIANNCVLAGNAAVLAGGGASSCTLSNCLLTGNTVSSGGWGGGAAYSTLINCQVISNLALGSFGYGGGVYQSTLNNCTLVGNWAGQFGGASYYGTLNNCVLTRNTATYGSGGGAYYGTLNNCTLTGNWARDSGGGAYFSTLNNCIIYYNDSGQYPNYYRSNLLSYCCTTPDPGGQGNITGEPLLASDSHLSSGSPCRGAGSSLYASGSDIDGEPWSNPPAIGADQLTTNGSTGPLTVAIQATWTNGTAGYVMPLVALIGGRASGSYWSLGDGTAISNHPYVMHAWQSPGEFPVVLTAFNQSNPGGIIATTMVQIANSLSVYVDARSANPFAPFQSWATAATNIQDAVDVAAQFGGSTVWVTNGLYATGGRIVFGTMSNRVAVSTPITVRSVNGPQFTSIQGHQVPGTTNDYGAIRCVYLTNAAALIGFTLTNGGTSLGDTVYEESGGGLWGESTSALASNCVLVGNTALHGGGASGATLSSCVLSNNSVFGSGVVGFGGGATACTLNDCVLTMNQGGGGGAVESCILSNCTLTANLANSIYGGGGAAYYGTLNNCILTGNSSAGGGGATYLANLTNCVLTDNSSDYGGGANRGTLVNCTIISNSSVAGYGGGIYLATAKNCIVYYNRAPNGSNSYSTTMSFCCTAPAVTGAGNLTNDPAFLALDSRDLRLAATSPCINSGNNAFVYGSNDLDGNPRIKGGTVDIGAYEFQNPTSVISYAWLQQYGLPTDGSADYSDTDNDGMSNWQEWIAGTNPNNAASELKMLVPVWTNKPSRLVLTWLSVTNKTYYLQRSTNLFLHPAFSSIKSNITGLTGTTSFIDTTATNPAPYFYRVGVQQ